MLHERDAVREEVFSRDNNQCIYPWCKSHPDDAHHLIERKLWSNDENGGYILDNMVSLCETHHKFAENNSVMPQTLRNWAGIKNIILPKTLDPSKEYDKWGHELARPNRVFIKYPHTPYLTFSPNADEKDVEESGYMDTRNLLNKPLYFSIKMDGSNVVITRDYVAARNGYDAIHPSYDMLKQLHAQFRHDVPENLMIFAEWLYAKHSIHYTDLIDYLQVFGVYNVKTCMWLSIPDVEKLCGYFIEKYDILYTTFWADHYNANTVLYENKVFTTEKDLRSAIIKSGNSVIKRGHEGIVVRNILPFHYSRWNENIAKYVRADHVQTDEHWSLKPIIRNRLLV